MSIRGWAPINTISNTDESGTITLEIVQLPILPAESRPPVCQCLGHDLLTHLYNEEEWPDESSDKSPRAPKKSSSKKTLQAKYQDYPAETSDQDIFDGDADLINHGNLYRLVKTHTMAEIANAVNAGRAESVLTPQVLSNRLKRTIDKMAKDAGRERDDVLSELRQAQKEAGVTINGRKRKSVPGEAESEKATTKKQKTIAKPESKFKESVEKRAKVPWVALEDRLGKTQSKLPFPAAQDQKVAKKQMGSDVVDLDSPKAATKQEDPGVVDLDSPNGKQKKKRKLPWLMEGDQKKAKKQKSPKKTDAEAEKENVPIQEKKPDRVVTSTGFVKIIEID